MSNLVRINVALDVESRHQLEFIKRTYKLANLDSAVEKSIKVACNQIKEKNGE